MRFFEGNSDSVADMRAAIGDAEVVVNALNLPYDNWFNGRMEAQMGRVIEALGTTGKTMLFPGNIYNFAASDREVTPDTPQHPETPRGEIRVRVEEMFQAAAARGDIQVIILRAGDFYGPGAQMDWFDQVVLKEPPRGRCRPWGSRASVTAGPICPIWPRLRIAGRAAAAPGRVRALPLRRQFRDARARWARRSPRPRRSR